MANKDWLKAGADGLEFGERLEDLYRSKEISQSQLAVETGLSQSAISEYINGKNGVPRAPDCASIIALSKYFSVSTDYLLGLTTTKSINEDVQAACRVTGLEDDHIYYQGQALTVIVLNRTEDNKRTESVIGTLRAVAALAGYEIEGRIILTEKEWKK